ncbi:hypothetical protein HPB47_021642 [Ixodes persulcatus]|uniref:Uncharacterized protein n=1 Tax=Ixodes persulcatus TaxID=34615 RepID=A0AC60QFG0_IXOPE|nr:hypothetical protein HPB47_021642 [Ixodes persulcatus]
MVLVAVLVNITVLVRHVMTDVRLMVMVVVVGVMTSDIRLDIQGSAEGSGPVLATSDGEDGCEDEHENCLHYVFVSLSVLGMLAGAQENPPFIACPWTIIGPDWMWVWPMNGGHMAS